MRNVMIGFLGSRLDAGGTAAFCWEKWRPTVSICQHEDFVVNRLELLYARPHQKLAQQIIEDIGSASPETTVKLHLVDPRDAWDFQEVYGLLHAFARAYPFDVENERYLMHITTGTHVAQICMFLLTEARYFPAALLQSSPPRRQNQDSTRSYAIIDLDPSKLYHLAPRFAKHQQRTTDLPNTPLN